MVRYLLHKESAMSSSSGGTVEIGTRRPADPSGAAFALVINFEKGTPNPQRVFQAADAMIRALQGLDKTLCAAVDSQIDPVMVLEDIEAGSIKAWLGNQLSRVEDEGLKTLDWKPVVGKYLVRAKYAVIRWSNKEGTDGNILGLAKELRTIATETDIRHVPDYAPPSVQELAEGVRRIDVAKDFLLPSDSMALISDSEGSVDFNLAVKWDDQTLTDLSVKETTKFEKMPVTLIVKKPDYLGKSKWDFRFGKKAISAKIEDEPWLLRFQTRAVDVRPGDALKCLATIEHRYGFDNELIAEEYTITTVEGVLANQLQQGSLGLDDSES
jgi:hypothetical protein